MFRDSAPARKIDIILVDGVGRPKIVSVDDDGYPETLGHAREHIKSGPDRIVAFDCTGELDADGRMIYRQRETRAAIRSAYLMLQPIQPFNTPRVMP